jgi:hypothetical protein
LFGAHLSRSYKFEDAAKAFTAINEAKGYDGKTPNKVLVQGPTLPKDLLPGVDINTVK